MANLETHDLMSIGDRCSHPGCGQVDFLPFVCDCCSKSFCLEHRTYASHDCPLSGAKETRTILCPLCAKAVKVEKGQDPNLIFEKHQREGCDTSNYAKVHKKKVCPVEGCREKLTTVNSFNCKKCGIEVCLNHRLSQDHNCNDRLNNMRVRQSWNMFNMPTASKMQMPKFGSQTQTTNKSTPASQGRLLCDYCGCSFGTKSELSSHIISKHSRPLQQNRQRSDRQQQQQQQDEEVCPHCGKRFDDVVKLVSHVERKRCLATSRSPCTIS